MADSKLIQIFIDILKHCVEDKIVENKGTFKCSGCNTVFNENNEKTFDRHNVLCVAHSKWKNDREVLNSVCEVQKWFNLIGASAQYAFIKDKYKELSEYLISSGNLKLIEYLEFTLLKFNASMLLKSRNDNVAEFLIKRSGPWRLYLLRSTYLKYCVKYNLHRMFNQLCDRLGELENEDVFSRVPSEFGNKACYIMISEMLWSGDVKFYEDCKKSYKVEDTYDLIKEHLSTCLSFAQSRNGHAKMYSHLMRKKMKFERQYEECLSKYVCKDVLGEVMSYV